MKEFEIFKSWFKESGQKLKAEEFILAKTVLKIIEKLEKIEKSSEK